MPSDSVFSVVIRVLVLGAPLVFFVGDGLGSVLLKAAAGVLFGLGLIVAGIQARRTGHIELWVQKPTPAEPLDSVPASTWGIVLMGAGATIILLVVALLLGLDHRVEQSLARFAATLLGQTIIWLILGSGAMVWGVSALKSKADWSLGGIVRSIPTRIFGIVLFMLGLAIFTVTMLRLVAPSWLDALAAALWEWFTAL